jgi:hypothetical protein
MVKATACVTAAVLGIIGIGVAFVGGLSLPARSYGHGVLSFSAAFPTRFTGSPVAETSPGGVGYRSNNYPDGYVAMVTGTLLADTPAVEIQELRSGTSTNQGRATVTSLPVVCRSFPRVGSYYCYDKAIVRENGVVWLVSATSPGSSAVAKAFVASFHPTS